MTTVTRITFRSGDRGALDGVVADVKATAQRKGAEFRGPHSESPEQLRVPQYARLDGDTDRRFPDWEYTVYTRRIELVGHDTVAQQILDREFPDSVRIEVEIEQMRDVGR